MALCSRSLDSLEKIEEIVTKDGAETAVRAKLRNCEFCNPCSMGEHLFKIPAGPFLVAITAAAKVPF